MINSTMLQNFRKDFVEAVKDLQAKYNINIELGTIHFGADEFSCKLVAKEVEGGSKDDLMEKEFYKYCSNYNLTPSDFLAKFEYRGDVYQVVGIRTSKRKYPIVCKNLNNNLMYGFPKTIKTLINNYKEE